MTTYHLSITIGRHRVLAVSIGSERPDTPEALQTRQVAASTQAPTTPAAHAHAEPELAPTTTAQPQAGSDQVAKLARPPVVPAHVRGSGPAVAGWQHGRCENPDCNRRFVRAQPWQKVCGRKACKAWLEKQRASYGKKYSPKNGPVTTRWQPTAHVVAGEGVRKGSVAAS